MQLENVLTVLFEQLRIIWESLLHIIKPFGALAEIVSGAGLVGTLITFGIGFVLVFLVARHVISNIKMLFLIVTFYLLFVMLIGFLISS